MSPTASTHALDLFNLTGQNVLITGATRGNATTRFVSNFEQALTEQFFPSMNWRTKALVPLVLSH
jgi:hypothetical protein